jgi:hypothetical protein
MVKCSECGFLAFRTRDSLEFVEAIESIRLGQRIPNALVLQMPFCFIRKLDFREAYGWERDSLGISEHLIYPVIQAERDCDGYTAWQQGFSPREHREMLDEERRLRLDADVRQMAWEREDRRDAEMRQREDERDERLRALQEKLHTRELLIFGGAVTLALVLGSIAAAIVEGAISRGWEPSWWPF